MSAAETTEARDILDEARRFTESKTHTLSRGDAASCPVIELPEGRTLHSVKRFLDEYLPKPERLKGTAKLETLASFILHVQRFQTPASAVFVRTGSSPSMEAVYDYHPGPSDAQFAQHRAAYAFPLSREWRAWRAADGKSMDQGAFAAWVEDHAGDVLPPNLDAAAKAVDRLAQVELKAATPTEILSLSRGLSVREECTVENYTKLPTGETRVLFASELKGADGAPLTIPGGFVVALPVFEGDAAYPVPVRLRMRVEKGRVSWSLAILGADDVLSDAVRLAADEVATKTGLPIFYGAPEV